MTDLNAITRPPSRQSLPADAQRVFQGHIFSVFQWQQEMFDGSQATFERLARNDTVGILAVLDNGTIMLTEQEQPSTKPFVSLLGGVIDPGETPFQAAKRELLEEAGLEAKQWKLWFATQPLTKVEWAVYMFIARGCTTVQEQQLDPGEKILLRPVEFDEFVAAVFQPEFRDYEVSTRVANALYENQLENLRLSLLGQ